MKTEIYPAIRSSPLVMNCFYFGAARGECHHPVNETRRCCVSSCAMLAADVRREALAIDWPAVAGANAFTLVR